MKKLEQGKELFGLRGQAKHAGREERETGLPAEVQKKDSESFCTAVA